MYLFSENSLNLSIMHKNKDIFSCKIISRKIHFPLDNSRKMVYTMDSQVR